MHDSCSVHRQQVACAKWRLLFESGQIASIRRCWIFLPRNYNDKQRMTASRKYYIGVHTKKNNTTRGYNTTEGTDAELPHPAWAAVHAHAWRPKRNNLAV